MEDSKYKESSNKPTPPPSEEIPKVVHVILRLRFMDICSEFKSWIKENTSNFTVCEHNADKDEKTSHCHMSLTDLKVTIEGLRKQIKKLKMYKAKCYTIMLKTEKSREPYNQELLDTYILKGGIDSTLAATSQRDEYITKRLSEWVDNRQEVKAKNETTIYDICKKVYENGKKNAELNYQGMLVAHFLPSIENWRLMCHELNLARIRTSRNELERVWVTILRQDDENCNQLFYSIQSNVFRNKT